MSSIPKDIIPFMQTIGELPRHLVSDGYNEALDLLLERAQAAGLQTVRHEYPTGYDCGTWQVPPKWTLHHARLIDAKGKVLFDSEQNGLHCMSYSDSFSGTVSREQLFEHLHTHANIDNAVPFAYSYYKKQWGLCCSENFKKTLTDNEYRVEIKTTFSDSHMPVGEIILRGTLDESFIIASHLCHPHQLNDGPIGSVVGIELLKALKKTGPNYTFRQLIMPETVGTAAWISSNKHLIPTLRGGLFCEMLTIDLPFVLNYSFMNDSLADRLFEEIVKEEASDNRCERFNYGNDERQFNGPGVLVPMQAIHRSNMHRFQLGQYDAYPEYHSDMDNIDLVSEENILRAYDIILKMLTSFDDYMVRPIAKFKGEPFLSRYNLQRDHISSFSEFMDIVNMCDRGLTIYEISKVLKVRPEKILNNLKPLIDIALIEYAAVEINS